MAEPLVNHSEHELEEDKMTLTQYVKSHFRNRTCNLFVPRMGQTIGIEDPCECLKDYDWHRRFKRPEAKNNERWTSETSTKTIECKTFGQLKLEGYRTALVGHQPKYIRLDVIENPEQSQESLWHVFCKYWKIPVPDVIISLNGKTKIDIGLEQFHKAVNDLSQNSATMVTGNGYNFGLNSTIGQVKRNYQIGSHVEDAGSLTVIGFASFGVIYKNYLLHEKYAMKRKHGTMQVVPYSKPPHLKSAPEKKGFAGLNPFFDAFVLCDDGRARTYGGETTYRAQFESLMARKTGATLVQLMVNGDLKSLNAAFNAIQLNIPVIVMKFSKGASDVICQIFDCPPEKVESVAEQEIKAKKEVWDIENDNEVAVICAKLVEMRRDQENLINIYDLKKDGDLDRKIVRSLVKADENMPPEKMLEICMAFSQAKLAKELIFKKNLIVSEEFMHECMMNALIQNKIEFVELLLEFGVQIVKMLTTQRLHDLYFMNSWIGRDINREMFGRARAPKNISAQVARIQLEKIGHFLENISNRCVHWRIYDDKVLLDVSEQPETKEEIPDDEIDGQSEDPKKFQKAKLCVTALINKKDKAIIYPKANTDMEKSQKRAFKFTKFPPFNKEGYRLFSEQDLFLWALVLGRVKLARIFWQSGKDQMGSGLVAAVICRNLVNILEKKGETDASKTMQSYQSEFENYSIAILNEAHKRDRIQTQLLLIRALPFWGRKTCLDIAVESECLDFLFHQACQNRMDTIWTGRISPSIPRWKILLNIPFGIFLTRGLIFPFDKSKKIIADEESDSDSDNDEVNHDAEKSRKKSENKKKKLTLAEIRDAKLETTEKDMFISKFRSKQKKIGEPVDFLRSLRLFYQTPIVKFLNSAISFIVFLFLFAFMNMITMRPMPHQYTNQTAIPTFTRFEASSQPHGVEIVVYIFVFSMICDEVRQFIFATSSSKFSQKLVVYLSSKWNWFDLLLYNLFLVSIVLRFTVPVEYFNVARTFFAIDLSLFIIRFMQYYLIDQQIGPKINMIYRMMKDLTFFIAIYSILMFSYGTLSQTLHYNAHRPRISMFYEIVYYPYWQTYNLDIDSAKGSENCDGNTCPQTSAVVVIGLALYMLFNNILLVNLLIAMFGNTFNQVEEISLKVWCSNRYRVIKFFHTRSAFPPPLNLLDIVINFVKFCVQRCVYNKLSTTQDEISLLKNDAFVVNLINTEDTKSSSFEQQCLEAIEFETFKKEQGKDIIHEIEQINEKISNFSPKNDAPPDQEFIPIPLQSQALKDLYIQPNETGSTPFSNEISTIRAEIQELKALIQDKHILDTKQAAELD